uniref:Restin homolog n=1 Tax=Cacopsylla melanoneura TaxID=428564 RepID=A0A8D9BFU1_9HEMI
MPSSVSFYSTSGSNRYSWSSQSNNDSSQILTEDTDSFIIGDRVYVGGTKSGRIAYIGETKFAPGDWAGIVLDDPVGKNDGTVGQCRYFQCDAKHGIFSRLTRLTRTPLDMPPPPATPTPSSYRGMEAGGGFVSPTGSARSLSFSTPGPGSTPAGKGSDIRLGDRVIVMSAQGSKTGVLRFKGTTQFAQGEWCGVELDEPVGKNDGTVEGVRYFQCEPRFGLFSPAHKVSKSPMSGTKRLSCAVHHGLRRSGSRESITSNFSNITATSVKSNLRRPSSIIKSPTSATPSTTSKNSMQDVLKEKQQHIERLLKERDFDRAEFTKLAEASEAKYVALRAEFDKFKVEIDPKYDEYKAIIGKLEEEKFELCRAVEDEKKKTEDFQFQFEEESLNSIEFQNIHKQNVDKIKELEAVLMEKNRRIESLESDSKKLFDLEEEVDSLKLSHYSSDEKSKSSLDGMKIQNELSQLEIAQLKQEIEENKADFIKQIETDSKKFEATVAELKAKIDDLTEENATKSNSVTEYMKELESVQAQLTKEVEATAKDYIVQINEIEVDKDKLEKKLDSLVKSETALKNTVDTLKQENEKLSKQANDSESGLKKTMEELKQENEKLQTELKAAKIDLETMTELKAFLKSVEEEKVAQVASIETLSKEKEELLNEISKTKEASEKLAQESREANESVKGENEKRIAGLNEDKFRLEKAVEELTNQMTVLSTEFDQTKVSLSEKQITIETVAKEKDEFARMIDEMKSVLGEMETSKRNTEKWLEEMKQQKENLEKEKEEKEKMVEKLTLEQSQSEALLKQKEEELATLVAEKQESATELSKRAEDLNAKYTALADEFGTFKTQVSAEKDELSAEIEKEREEKRKIVEELKNELKNLASEMKKEEETKDNVIKFLKNDLELKVKSLQDATEALNEAKERMEKMEEEAKKKLEEVKQEQEQTVDSLRNVVEGKKEKEKLEEMKQEQEQTEDSLRNVVDLSGLLSENYNR